MRIALAVLMVVLLAGIADASEWAVSIGGSSDDWANSIQQTSDGGYIVAGVTYSFGSRGDAWILKLDSNGNVQWQKAYGGSSWDFASAVQQTSDGGYIVAGGTCSFGSSSEVWILKLDSSGNIEWQKVYAGSDYDGANSIQQTSDGGYIVAGKTYSFGYGNSDVWILKLDSNGNIEWQKVYGGISGDWAKSIQQTSDGGYIVAGGTCSFGSSSEVWILKLDSSGNIEWQKVYGGSGGDGAGAIQQTSDGGYIVAGWTDSFGSGGDDVWLLKLDSSGNIEWQKVYGGCYYDEANSIQQTSDGGYIVAGGTYSFGYGDSDVWILKLDSNGNIEWQKVYGGSDDNGRAHSIQQTSDGGYIVAGETWPFGIGYSDVWILKLDSNGSIPDCNVTTNTNANIVTTSATVTNTSAHVMDTLATVKNTNAIVTNTDASVTQVCWAEATNQPPVASFTFYPTNPVPGEYIAFDASSSYDPDGQIISYSWDFDGDGVVDATESQPSYNYAYSSPATYTVTLTVMDNDGLTSSTSRQITVQSSTPLGTDVIRTLPSWTQPGSTFQVTLTSTASTLGMQITETIPSGFTFINYTYSGADSINFQRSGDTLNFTVTDIPADGFTITYTLQAPTTKGTYIFSGTYQAMNGSTYAIGGDTTITVSAGESNPDGVDDTLEQLVTKYYSDFDWTTETPEKEDVLNAVINAVQDYFSTNDPTEQQEIVGDVIQLVQLYFSL